MGHNQKSTEALGHLTLQHVATFIVLTRPENEGVISEFFSLKDGFRGFYDGVFAYSTD